MIGPAGEINADGRDRAHVTVGADALERFAVEILTAAGLVLQDAEAAAEGLIAANLCGMESHGVLRLLQYVESIEAGQINTRPEVRAIAGNGATALIDADGGYGYRPSFLAVDMALELADKFGVGFVGVRRSHHFGMAGLYAARGAAAGAITFTWTNASPRIAPWGAVEPVLGNNPLSWAVPRRAAPPIVLDIALSQVAFGKVRLARAEGRAIPAGWGLDRAGKPTTDAEEAFASGLLSPIGGYKGSGLSLIAEILTGCLTGSPFALGTDAHNNRDGGVGHVFAAIDVEAFGPRHEFQDRVEALVSQVRSAKRGDGGGQTYLPGEIEQEQTELRLRDGIPISAALCGQLRDLADRLSVASGPLS